jgi:hypothetical protein
MTINQVVERELLMSLVLDDPQGRYFVSIGMKVGWPEYGGPDYYPLIVDPIPWSLVGVVIPFGVAPCNALVGAYEDRGLGNQEVLRTKPKDRLYDGARDWSRYGTGLSGFSLFLKTLAGESISFSPANEHETVHSTFFGRVFPSHTTDVPFPLYDYDYSYIGSPGFVNNWFNPVYSPQFGEFYQGLNALYGENDPLGYNFRFAAVGGGTDSLPGIPFDWWYTAFSSCAGPIGRTFAGSFVGYPLTSTVTGLRRKRLSDGWRISYHLRWAIGSEFTCDHDISFTLTHDPTLDPPDHHFAGGASSGVEIINTQHPIVQRYEDVVTGAFGANQASWFSNTGRVVGSDHQFSFETWSAIQQLESPWSAEFHDGPRSGTSLSSLGSSHLLPEFTRLVEADIGSIRCSSFHSTSDAFTSVTDGFGNDLIQTLVKLNDLSSLVPSISEAWLAVRKLKGGDAIGGFGSLIDFLTSLHLQANFTWRSDYELLVKYGPDMAKTMLAASKIVDSESIVARGSFHFDFPFGSFGRKESFLLTRSRVVLSPVGRQALASVLGLKAIGLLPSPSVAWDLFPFSFVVNWFTGIGRRIVDIENMTLLSLLGIERYTHSYLITSPLTDDELRRYGLESSPESASVAQPSLRIFVRDVSSLTPFPREGKFDFGAPQGLPNWMIPGSLLWQVFS